ncbi:hypothetical protein HOI18_04015 [Candidatus Uhrbacteria bacterium]|jgi:hypothetical protein|nr:hypothetical protein [Candidatus Uhrbacteria bacterium]
MRFIKNVATFFIVIIALGAALYIQRVAILDWYVEATAPALPESVGFDEVEEVEEVAALPVVDESLPTVDDVVVDEVAEDVIEEVVEDLIEEDVVVDELVEAEEFVLPLSINLAVPFTSQAPHANWDYPYKETCEEASVYMVHRYFEGEPEGMIDAQKADDAILKIVAFEEGLFGYYEDTTVEQTGIFAEMMYGFSSAVAIEDPTVDDIKTQLAEGRPVIVPAAGRMLGNPYFTAPGPIYHMLVVRGYTEDDQFIVNDPGTKRGEAYLYDVDTLMSAIHDWNDGEEITDGGRVVLVLNP